MAPLATFLDLPAELRNTIYTLALTNTTTLIETPSNKPNTTHTFHSTTDQKIASLKTLALIHSNAQIRRECLGIFFASTTFVFFWPENAVRWLRALPAAQRGMVRRMRRVLEFTLERWTVSDDVEAVREEVEGIAARVGVEVGGIEIVWDMFVGEE